MERRLETEAALRELGVVKPPLFEGFRDDAVERGWIDDCFARLAKAYGPGDVIYLPWQEPRSHDQHNLVGHYAEKNFAKREGVIMKHYTTYSTDGKTVGSHPVHPHPDHVIRKLRALACYKSQITVVNCREHFMRGLHEYYA